MTKVSGVRRALRRAALAVLLVVATAAGVVGGVAAFFLAATVASSIALLAASGVATLLLVTGGLALLSCRWLSASARVRRWVPPALAGGTLLVVGTIAATELFRPMNVAYVPMEADEATWWWELETGSRIAWVATRAQGGAGRAPVIMLHGGPGAPYPLATHPEDSVLAAAGFDVYRYHQVGAGLSSRLEDPGGYSVARHVTDLEAIRAGIGAERFILVGGSWGAILGARYMAAHPERVERAVFTAPGALWEGSWTDAPRSDGDEQQTILEAMTLRFAAVYTLARVNPRAAARLATDEEMSGFMQPLLGGIIDADVAACGGQPVATERPRIIPRGFGFFGWMMTDLDLRAVEDPRPRLGRVDVPVLVVRGECDRIRPEVATEYRDVFPNARLVELGGVAHAVTGSPEYPALLRDFLRKGDQGAAEDGRHARGFADTTFRLRRRTTHDRESLARLDDI